MPIIISKNGKNAERLEKTSFKSKSILMHDSMAVGFAEFIEFGRFVNNLVKNG